MTTTDQANAAQNPYDLVLPDWFTSYRPHQLDAIEQIMDAYKRGVRMVVLDAPTGSGKTLIGETVRRLLEGRALYVCNNKSLQDQFVRDYNYAAILKGRSNYQTWDDRTTCDDCTFTPDKPCAFCPYKSQCPYEVAKQAAVRNPLAVLNTAYTLAECNGPGKFRDRDIAIWDEADTLEDNVMGFVGFAMSRRRVEQLGLGEPAKVTKEDAWIDWVNEAIGIVDSRMPILHGADSLVQIRQYNFMQRLAGNLKGLQVSLPSGGWVYTGKDGRVEFKPVRVDSIASVIVWRLAQRHLLMSATVISADELLASLGWREPYEVVSMGSTFDKANRQVKVVSCANMSRKVNEVDKLIDGLRRVLARHPDERVLVHTVSYDLAKEIASSIGDTGRSIISYTRAMDRESAITKFKRAKAGVLVASSLDRGIDLPDDLCRVVVVAKVPFPYLGDRQISARLHSPGGQQWYTVKTIRSLVQMTGRHVRHADDYGVSYILDSQFERGVWGKNRELFPQWWVEAIDWRDRLQ